jgi:hypothetical protein
MEENVVKRAGGVLVKDYGTHFLRDDAEIRKGIFEQEEAYSLFRVSPYERIVVYVSSRDEAIELADSEVEKDLKEKHEIS